ncbi:MAG: 2-hydroxyglutaryl-CoA dehydratase [Bacteroidales bacterium]|nr:2-hydroxyglutaryl-CoA dehydratase [Bacteroidales bacterium]
MYSFNSKTNENFLNIGIDAGSTTLKITATDTSHHIVYKKYCRHYADISGTLHKMLQELIEKIGDFPAKLCITGSAGMGIAERSGVEFVQEVVASCEVIAVHYPEVQAFVDIGGEDSKMIFFSEGKSPDIRMNGSCAGGTGSFIDQMTTLLNVEMDEFNQLAENGTTIYPIASRCGVFSKTDVQNLLARNICKEDIALSVFHAVSMQVITSLARGYELNPKVFLCGGPLTFIPELRKAFLKVNHLQEEDIILSENSEVIPAWGSAIVADAQNERKLISEYDALFQKPIKRTFKFVPNKLKPLFSDEKARISWKKSKEKYKLPYIDISEIQNPNCFIGIDSGSTTTKIVATDENGNVFFRYYTKNNGLSLYAVEKGLKKLLNVTQDAGLKMNVLGSCVTGYGEDLIKKAFQLDAGMVETIAHYMGAYHFNKDVSFILDIGGQDMKAVFIENGIIKRLEINEACSSGCGSFIETFAKSLNFDVSDFSKIALQSKNPCDLGTRCTVFMNSKVKQAQREGALPADISSGLGYSVIKNCLNKVLKLKDTKELGEHIMVQGGTFRNLSVIRALELELGKEVMITDFPELMGAYGTALYAKQSFKMEKTTPRPLSDVAKSQPYTEKKSVCKGCENNCTVTRFKFENGNIFYSGNKCEKIFSNSGDKHQKGINQHAEKYALLFDRPSVKAPLMTLGMPRALGAYENYPFWHALFSACNIRLELSDTSTMKQYETGIGTVMADNICFPAKLVHGHVLNLIDKQVDRIFMPFVVYEKKEDTDTVNSYNCPIVSAYSDVIRSAIDPEENFGVPLDSPTFTFANRKLMKKACREYIHQLLPEIKNKTIDRAFETALRAQLNYEKSLTVRSKEILANAVSENRLVILLAGRPYHIDPLIQHKIADMVTDFGADVISEDVVRELDMQTDEVQSVMQWAYTNRIFKSALWAANDAPTNVNYVQITSFGCGPDAFILDEVKDIMHRTGKNATIIKVDDINNLGSTRLRIRSLIESLKFKKDGEQYKKEIAVHTPPFMNEDRRRTIIGPWFGDLYSPFIPPALELLGYKYENLPPSDIHSVEFGLKYSNNEICYPATLVVGDMIKALESGKYHRDEIAIGISQTGGQCRATNYVALIKKAMIAAGYGDIPVVTVSTSNGNLNYQPGMKVKWRKVIKSVLTCIVYADCISQFYYSTAPRENEKGTAKILRDKYIDLGIEVMRTNDDKRFYKLVKEAADEFLKINNRADIPRIGIVGEIYVKYNNFGHKNVVNWLIEQGVEPVLPPLSKFFLNAFASREARVEGNVHERSVPKFITDWVEKYAYKIIRKMEAGVTHYPYYIPVSNVHEDAQEASKIINLNSQFGEGWGIPAEFGEFAHNGVNNVVSLQPFGCIANHVISKGIEKRTREIYPDLNLLFLDFDSGMSEANIFNRLHFMIKNAQNSIVESQKNEVKIRKVV